MNSAVGRCGFAALTTVLMAVTWLSKSHAAGNERVPAIYPMTVDARQPVAVWSSVSQNDSRVNAASLGPAPVCTFHDASGKAIPNSSCHVAFNTNATGGSQLVFSPPPPSGTALVKVGVTVEGARETLEIPIETCTFSAVEPYATLYAGATSQLLQIRGSSPACEGKLKVQTSLELVSGNVRLHAQLAKSNNDESTPGRAATESDDTRIWLSVATTPATLTDTWALANSLEPSLGALNVRTAPNPIAIATDESGAPVLGVHYESEFFEQRHAPTSVEGNAVVTASEQRDPDFLYVRNQPKVTIATLDALVRHLQAQRFESDDKTKTKTKATCKLDEDNGGHKCEYDTNPWKVESLTWHDSAWIYYPEGRKCSGPKKDGTCTSELNEQPDGWASGEVLLESLDALTFSVFQAELRPFEVLLTLRDPAKLERTLFQTQVTLAKAARRESIALPIKEMLYVACGELGAATIVPEIAGFSERLEGVDLAVNGTTRAINEDDLKAGECFLQYSPTRYPESLQQRGKTRRQTIESLVHFGRQEVEVVLRRGASEKKVLWTIDPTREQSIPLPQPAESKETGVYVVHAIVRGPMPPDVIYRPAAPTNATERPIVALGDLEFKANLRPRGRFGWVSPPIRTFVTIPVELAGFRFPSNARELESSSDNTVVQIVTGRTGLLFAIEPWDYDRGTNPWPVPARWMSGMSLFRIGEGRFVPSLMNGIQISVPVLDLPKGSAEDQLGTDASLGFFWEHDLQPGGGDHLLVTVGANLLTLFGSK